MKYYIVATKSTIKYYKYKPLGLFFVNPIIEIDTKYWDFDIDFTIPKLKLYLNNYKPHKHKHIKNILDNKNLKMWITKVS